MASYLFYILYFVLCISVFYFIIKKQHILLFPLIFTIFFFVISLNLVGLVPYSFTLTSHLVVTFTLSIAIFTGVGAVLAALVLSGVKKKVRSVTEINTRASLVRIWLKRFG